MKKSFVLKITKPCNIELINTVISTGEKEYQTLEIKEGLEVYHSKKYAETFLNDYKLRGGNGYILKEEERTDDEKYNNSPYTREQIKNL